MTGWEDRKKENRAWGEEGWKGVGFRSGDKLLYVESLRGGPTSTSTLTKAWVHRPICISTSSEKKTLPRDNTRNSKRIIVFQLTRIMLMAASLQKCELYENCRWSDPWKQAQSSRRPTLYLNPPFYWNIHRKLGFCRFRIHVWVMSKGAPAGSPICHFMHISRWVSIIDQEEKNSRGLCWPGYCKRGRL